MNDADSEIDSGQDFVRDIIHGDLRDGRVASVAIAEQPLLDLSACVWNGHAS